MVIFSYGPAGLPGCCPHCGGPVGEAVAAAAVAVAVSEGRLCRSCAVQAVPWPARDLADLLCQVEALAGQLDPRWQMGVPALFHEFCLWLVEHRLAMGGGAGGDVLSFPGRS
jgi:hypothetical protein